MWQRRRRRRGGAAELARPPHYPRYARGEWPAGQQQLGPSRQRQGLLPELRPRPHDAREGRVDLHEVVEDEALDEAPQPGQRPEAELDVSLQGLDAAAAALVGGVGALDRERGLDPGRRGEERRGGEDAEAEGPRARAAAAASAAAAEVWSPEAIVSFAVFAALLLLVVVSVFFCFFFFLLLFFSSLELVRVVVDNVDVLEGAAGQQGAEPKKRASFVSRRKGR